MLLGVITVKYETIVVVVVVVVVVLLLICYFLGEYNIKQ